MPEEAPSNADCTPSAADTADSSSADESAKNGLNLERTATFKDYLVRVPFMETLGHLLIGLASFHIRKNMGHHRVCGRHSGSCRCWGHHAANVRPVRYAHQSFGISSRHLIDARSGDFVGNFSSFVNGDVQDLGDFENDLDRLWYVARPFHTLRTVYLQAPASTSLPYFSLGGASVPSTNLRSESAALDFQLPSDSTT